MKRVTVGWVAAMVLLLVVQACAGGRGVGRRADKLGSDSDGHGCKSSAGYRWSELLADCIRPFEQGVRVVSATDSTRAAYVVFSPDSARLELFMPNERVVLDRRQLPSGHYTWNVEDDDTKNVTARNGYWQVFQRAKLIYEEAVGDRALRVLFLGSDGRTKRFYPLMVTFFPARELAVLNDGERSYELKQYRTASGYGYSSDLMDLRGKGTKATLTYKDGRVLELVEDR